MPEQQVQEPQNQTEEIIEPIAEPTGTTNDIAQVEEPVMQDFRHDAKIDFKEFTRSIRERGERVTHRVAMNSLPQNMYQFN